MVAVFKDQETGLTYSKMPKKRLLAGTDSEGPSVIWSSILPMFFTSQDGNEQIDISSLGKPSVRLLPPFDSIRLETEDDKKKAMALFRRIWVRVFPEFKRHYDGYSNRTVWSSENKEVSVEEFVERVRRGREKLSAPYDCLSFDTDEEAQDSTLVMSVLWSTVVFENNRASPCSTSSATQHPNSRNGNGVIK